MKARLLTALSTSRELQPGLEIDVALNPINGAGIFFDSGGCSHYLAAHSFELINEKEEWNENNHSDFVGPKPKQFLVALYKFLETEFRK